jgi:hypothetical protein
MLRLRRSRGDAQHERAWKSQEGLPFALSPSASSGQATHSEVEGQMRLVLSPLQKGFLYTAAVAFLANRERETAGWGSPTKAALAPPCFNENEGGSAAGSPRSTPLHAVSLPKTTTSGLSRRCRLPHRNSDRAPADGAR